MRSGQLLALLTSSIAASISRAAATACCGGVGRLDRRAEQRQKAVAEELVHDAAMPVQDFDQDRERAVEPLDHLLRRPHPRSGGKAAEIDEHHGDMANVA